MYSRYIKSSGKIVTFHFYFFMKYLVNLHTLHTGGWLIIKHKLNVISNYSLLPSPACDVALKSSYWNFITFNICTRILYTWCSDISTVQTVVLLANFFLQINRKGSAYCIHCKVGLVVVRATEYTEWQRPLSGVLSIMMEKLPQAGEGGGCTPHPISLYLPSRTQL